MYQSSLNNKFPTCPPEAARSVSSWRKICNCCWRPSKVKPSPVSAPATTWELSFPSQTMGSSNRWKDEPENYAIHCPGQITSRNVFLQWFFFMYFHMVPNLLDEQKKKALKNCMKSMVPSTTLYQHIASPWPALQSQNPQTAFSPSLPFPCTQALDSSNWSTWTANHKVSWQSPQYFKSYLACAKQKPLR